MSDSGWCTIESDPGVFTELLEKMGIQGVQVEELYSLDESSFSSLGNVFGLIFLFKWQAEPASDKVVDYVPGLYFAKQIVNNACATQAILNILLNRADVQLSQEIASFKEFTLELPAEERGIAIGNSDLLRRVHNSFGRPEPFVMAGQRPADKDDDLFHFVGYVPFNGHLYELDGLQPGPIDHGACTAENWVNFACPVIQQRMDRYVNSEIRFSLMAIVQNRLQLLTAQLVQAEGSLAGVSPDGTDNIRSRIAMIKQDIATEQERRANWQLENVQRRHNYVPFIMTMLKILAEKGELLPLLDQANAMQDSRR